ncbi:MAG: hypothetical protein AAF429_04920 [Pseudomonadota bacterium]
MNMQSFDQIATADNEDVFQVIGEDEAKNAGGGLLFPFWVEIAVLSIAFIAGTCINPHGRCGQWIQANNSKAAACKKARDRAKARRKSSRTSIPSNCTRVVKQNNYPSGGGGSDLQIKQDVRALGVAANGHQLYSWSYQNDDRTRYVGVMAQDLTTLRPDALFNMTDGEFVGHLGVNYDALGLRMATEEEFFDQGAAAVLKH